MKHFIKSFTWKDYIFFVISGILFYLIIHQYIPCVEDFDYLFNRFTEQTIDTLRDAIISQSFDYLHKNGRFLVHVLVQYFCGVTGPIPFYIGSSLCYIVLVMSLTYIVRRQFGYTMIDKYLLSLFMLFFIPIWGMTFAGHIAFVVNYLWSAAFYMFFLCVYIHLRDDNVQYNVWQSVVLCIFALIVGSWQESFSLGIAGTLFVYHIFNFRKTRGTLLAFLICFAIGVCTSVLAPGNFVRLNSGNSISFDTTIESYLHSVIYQSIMLIKHSRPITAFVIFIVVAFVMLRKRTFTFFKTNYLYISPIVLFSIFSLFVAYSGEHQFVIVGVLTTLLFVLLLYDQYVYWFRQWQIPITIIVTILLLVMFVPIYMYRAKIVDAHDKLEYAMTHSADSMVVATDVEDMDRCVISNSYFRQYTNLYFIHYTYTTEYFAKRYSYYLNREAKTSIKMILPESKGVILSHCVDANQLSKNVYAVDEHKYLIVLIPTDADPTEVQLSVQTISTSYMDKFKDRVMHRIGKPKIDTHPFASKQFPDFYRYFIEGEMRYVIVEYPVNRQLVTALVEYDF